MQIEAISGCVGARCTVLSIQNRILFIGKVGYYDATNRKVRVDWGDQSPLRSAMDIGDSVKLQIRQGGSMYQFVIVEGPIEQILNNYILVTPLSVIEKSEEREYFRQPVMEPAIISFVNRKAAGDPCMIVDVSATGISIQSNAIYEVGDSLWLYNQPLYPGGVLHSLEFQVVRKSSLPDGKFRSFYGCKFIHVETDAQDKLFSDIFILQSTSLRSIRK